MPKKPKSVYERQVAQWHKVQKRKAKLKAAEEVLKDLDAAVMEQLVEDGLSKVGCEGRTLFIKTDLWAGKNDQADWLTAAERIKEAGLEDWLSEKFNAQSVSAIFRQKDKDITSRLLAESEKTGENVELSDEERIKEILTHIDEAGVEHDLSDVLKVSRTYKLGSTVGSTK